MSRNAGWLGILAILTAIFGGSLLFVTLEGYFDVIYHTRSRATLPQNIMSFITSHLPSSEQAVQAQAAASHKEEEPKDILPKGAVKHLADEAAERKTTEPEKQPARPEPEPARQSTRERSLARLLVFVEALTGTALAFLIEFFRLCRKGYS